MKGRTQANAVAQQALIAHWQSIVKCLNNYLKTMRANYVSINFKRVVKRFYFCVYIITLFLYDWTGSSIPSSQGFYTDILIYQCPVV